MIDFDGHKLNFIQIGLGSNSTFIQNIAGTYGEFNRSIGWLLEACSEYRPEHVRGIAVEPVKDFVDAHEVQASRLPKVQLVHAAMGEFEESGVEMRSLSLEMRDELLEQVPPCKRAKLTEDLEYVRNMSCLGGEEHPFFPMWRRCIEYNYDLTFDMSCHEKANIWTWAKLANTLNFKGCEVVVIDTEGYDTKILRSMVSYCREHANAWPELIQFETMGHCDRYEGPGCEKQMIRLLENEGYTLVALSDHNSHLVSKDGLSSNDRMKAWLGGWYCTACWQKWMCPYMSLKTGIFCQQCYDFFVERDLLTPLDIDWVHCPSAWGRRRRIYKGESMRKEWQTRLLRYWAWDFDPEK